MEIAYVENGFADGEIQFSYHNLMCAIKHGHPADILDDIFIEVGDEVLVGIDVPDDKVKKMLTELIELKKAFKIKEMNKHIKSLTEYLKTREGGNING